MTSSQAQTDLWAGRMIDHGDKPGRATWDKYGITNPDDQRMVTETYEMFLAWDAGKLPADQTRDINH